MYISHIINGIKHLSLIPLLVVIAETVKYNTDCYNSTRLKAIPADHIYFKLLKPKKPIVIGHKGNIKKHQENTLEGMKSLLTIKAGGMHMQVRLTKDNKLILCGDDRLERLTGLNYQVGRLPYSEILKMPLQKTIEYPLSDTKTKKMTYSSRPIIPLLQDVLEAVKGKGLLIYLELLPSNVPPTGPLDRHRGLKTSELTVQLIRKLKLEKEVIVVSRDAFKLKALDYYGPELVSGWWMDTSLFTPTKGNEIRKVYHEIPDIYYTQCFEKQSNGSLFTEYLLRSGIVSKAVNASLIDLSLDIYNLKKTEIRKMVDDNYGLGTPLGAFGISLWDFSKNDQSDVSYIQNAVDNGVTRFITDDVNRIKTALNEATTGAASRLIKNNFYAHIVITILMGKAFITLLFV